VVARENFQLPRELSFRPFLSEPDTWIIEKGGSYECVSIHVYALEFSIQDQKI